MDAYDSLRQVLEQNAAQAATDISLKLILPNEQANPPVNEIWGEFWHRTGKVKPSLGGGRKHFKCAAGLMQFTLYAPEKMGNGPITRLADQLEKSFSSRQYSVPPDGYVVLDDLVVDQYSKTVNGRYAVLVYCTFDFHYRDPDADG